ncbi:MAG: hypothetical protein KatS3mg061_2163 [Dehalococcoidia bacterium]|nr:MAG: hypothetical protein KatS3mg061_2163 [Dehalococcoidia bacterium]
MRIENCQIGVFLAYAGPQGHAFLERERYLPREWADDATRRAEAGVSEGVEFRAKPQLAQAMLERALEAGMPFGWVTGDEVDEGDRRLRLWLEARDVPPVLAISGSVHLIASTEQGAEAGDGGRSGRGVARYGLVAAERGRRGRGCTTGRGCRSGR